ncbi:hypothetical protein RDWZM_001807 [Blomia tropicalis]|uniref:Uncharacterized protein n=1 Tax=Blomia tropicalis TaxID=40697 RepID=A0A9Q0MF73_BLOTA|nr:hypothetical protein RDWZM_001807 [Blomia tropicalis]
MCIASEPKGELIDGQADIQDDNSSEILPEFPENNDRINLKHETMEPKHETKVNQTIESNIVHADSRELSPMTSTGFSPTGFWKNSGIGSDDLKF